MNITLATLNIAGAIPLGLALWANRRTSLLHALIWALLAWLSWGVAFLSADATIRYCALCLTGCAGVAVLGARRPHVFAWNFVVLGLFAVMMLPLVEAQVIGTQSLGGLRIIFLAGTLAVGILNYLPTRLGPAAFLLMVACAAQITILYEPAWFSGFAEQLTFDFLLMATPWLAWCDLLRTRSSRSPFDQRWLSFRDRWGLVWSQRVREQFNNSAEHAGWPIKLGWGGLVVEKDSLPPDSAELEKFNKTLQATLQRFLPAN